MPNSADTRVKVRGYRIAWRIDGRTTLWTMWAWRCRSCGVGEADWRAWRTAFDAAFEHAQEHAPW